MKTTDICLDYIDKCPEGQASVWPAALLLFEDVLGARYALDLQVPAHSVLIEDRLDLTVGARVWIAVLMICWGVVSGAMMWVTTPASYYATRFLLGVAEAGFFPGVIFYFTQ